MTCPRREVVVRTIESDRHMDYTAQSCSPRRACQEPIGYVAVVSAIDSEASLRSSRAWGAATILTSLRGHDGSRAQCLQAQCLS